MSPILEASRRSARLAAPKGVPSTAAVPRGTALRFACSSPSSSSNCILQSGKHHVTPVTPPPHARPSVAYGADVTGRYIALNNFPHARGSNKGAHGCAGEVIMNNSGGEGWVRQVPSELPEGVRHGHAALSGFDTVQRSILSKPLLKQNHLSTRLHWTGSDVKVGIPIDERNTAPSESTKVIFRHTFLRDTRARTRAAYSDAYSHTRVHTHILRCNGGSSYE